MSNLTIGIGLVVLFIVMYIKITLDEKKGVNSEEKRRISEIVEDALDDGDSYMSAYGTREDFALSGSGRTIVTTTNYWYYAVAFKSKSLCLIPLMFEEGDISYDEPMFFDNDNLGMVEIKNGYMTLYDKDNKEIFPFRVDASNTKDDKYHPVNIQQPEETAAFWAFAEDFMHYINSSNGVTDVQKAKKAAKKK